MAACLTQARTAVSVMSSSRATCPMLLPLARTSPTTSALYSVVNFRRFRRSMDPVSITLEVSTNSGQAQIEATTIQTPRSPPLGVARKPVGWVARGAPPRSPRDRDSLAPAGLPRFLDLEVPSQASGSTTGRLGACGSRAHHGAGEPALGRATHSRRAAQARF